jgi:hypothetical protein
LEILYDKLKVKTYIYGFFPYQNVPYIYGWREYYGGSVMEGQKA